MNDYKTSLDSVLITVGLVNFVEFGKNITLTTQTLLYNLVILLKKRVWDECKCWGKTCEN